LFGWVVALGVWLGEGLVFAQEERWPLDVDYGGAVEEPVEDGGDDNGVAAE
jgi:hypothetical protein